MFFAAFCANVVDVCQLLAFNRSASNSQRPKGAAVTPRDYN